MSLKKSPAPTQILLESEAQAIAQLINFELKLRTQEKWEHMTMETKEKEGKLFFKRIFLTLTLDFNKIENQPKNAD